MGRSSDDRSSSPSHTPLGPQQQRQLAPGAPDRARRGGSAPKGLAPRPETAGTPTLFDRLYRRAFDAEFESLFRYVDRWSGDPALAADVAQETFIRLYRRGQLPEDLRAWLVSVANNLLRDERRRLTRRERLLGRYAGGPEVEDAERGAEAQVLAEERRQAVRAALDNLRPRERSLLLLRHEGYSYRDLAVALHLRESSVGTLLARARERFRAAMEERHLAPD